MAPEAHQKGADDFLVIKKEKSGALSTAVCVFERLLQSLEISVLHSSIILIYFTI